MEYQIQLKTRKFNKELSVRKVRESGAVQSGSAPKTTTNSVGVTTGRPSLQDDDDEESRITFTFTVGAVAHENFAI